MASSENPVSDRSDYKARRGSGAIVVIGLLAAAIIIAAASWLLIRPPALVLQGEVDATQINIASKAGGRIKSLPVTRGDTVKAGDTLVELDGPELKAKLAKARAALAAAQAAEEKAKNGARVEEIQVQKSNLQKAQAVATQAERTVERLRSLYETDSLALQGLENAERDLEVARKTAEAAQAAYDLTVAGARDEDKAAATAQVQAAAAQVAELESLVEDLLLTAPIGAEVANTILEPGELAGQGLTLVSLVDLSDVWLVFHLRENLLAKIHNGTEFEVTVPALDNRRIKVAVQHIAVMGDFATRRATRASGDFDLKTFEVRAVPLEPVPGLRPGMSVLLNWKELK